MAHGCVRRDFVGLGCVAGPTAACEGSSTTEPLDTLPFYGRLRIPSAWIRLAVRTEALQSFARRSHRRKVVALGRLLARRGNRHPFLDCRRRRAPGAFPIAALQRNGS